MNPKPLLIALVLVAALAPRATRPDTVAEPKAPANAAPAPAPAAGTPSHFEPTEKTRADYAISFPSDI